MTRSKLGLLAVCAMVLGLMAFSTAGAQATAGAKWLILTAGEKPVVKEGSTLHALLGLETESPTLILHTEILKIKVLFLCTAVKAVNAKLLAEGSIGESAGNVKGSKVLFSGCTTDLNGVTEPACKPTDPTDGSGFIVTNAGHALLVLGTAGEKLTNVVPDSVAEEPVFATISTGTKTSECPIGSSVPVIGKLFLKDCENKGSEHLVKHLVEEGPGTKLFTISLTAEHAATLLGSAWAFLENSGAEEHKGLKFGGDWA